MEKNFSDEQIALLNRVVFAHIDTMMSRVIEVVEETEKSANQELEDNGIDMTDFYPANKQFLMMTIVQKLIDEVHGGNMAQAQKIVTMEARRLNVTVHVDAENRDK